MLVPPTAEPATTLRDGHWRRDLLHHGPFRPSEERPGIGPEALQGRAGCRLQLSFGAACDELKELSVSLSQLANIDDMRLSSLRQHTVYDTFRQGYVDGIEFFDAKFFGISSMEARLSQESACDGCCRTPA